MTADVKPYFCPGCGWNICRCADGGWRGLERARVADLQARGKEPRYVSWECHHGTHDPLPTLSVHAHKRGLQFQIKAKDAA